MSRQYSNVKNENDVYICNISYLGKSPDKPKIDSRAGIHILEEAMLDILPAPEEQYMSINDIKARLDLVKANDDHFNWAGFIIERILKKLEHELRAQPEVTQTEKGVERRIGWRLSKNEYQKRIDNTEEYIDE